MNITQLFPTSIATGSIPEVIYNQDALVGRALEIQKEVPVITHGWNCDTYGTIKDYDLRRDPVYHTILDRMAGVAHSFAMYYGAKEPKVVCVNSWLNIAAPENYQEYHNHPNSHISLVVYLKTQKDCGDIVFESYETSSSANMYPLPVSPGNRAHQNLQTYSVEPQVGNFVCFKSNLNHMVKKNKSNEVRISMAANFQINI